MKTFRLLSGSLVILTLTAIAFCAFASPVIVLPAGSVWRYSANGTDQGSVWRAPSFDDSAWPSGPAQLGFGDGDEVTVLQPGTVTAYFRRAFQSQVNGATSLTVRLLRDDGAVVYLNGVEVFRSNMPPGPVSYNTVATVAVGGAEETSQFITAQIDPSVLVQGANVIAVEVHQVNLTSSDLSFDLELIAEAGPTLPVVSINAIDAEAAELSPLVDAPLNPGVFRITRDGPLTSALQVGYALSGTASNGTDYLPLSGTVEVPVGAASVDVFVDVIHDMIAEGDETVLLRLIPPVCATVVPPPPGCYLVGTPDSARVVIHDSSVPNVPPTVRFASPTDGAIFIGPTNILLNAIANDGNGYLTLQTVEFFEGTQSLGIRTNYPTLTPGNPFMLQWQNVPLGEYTLTAIATDDLGARGTSAPVHIHVVSSPADISLVSFGAAWRYMDQGIDLGTAWREIAFDDSAWASGPAQLGYGDGDEATVVSFGSDPNNKFITTYFRRSFQIPNGVSISALRGRLLQDDGGAVYLNGVEVFRSNLPFGPLPFNTLAIVASPDNQIVEFTAPASLLREGLNALAVEMHQNSPVSSDLSFDLELIGQIATPPPELPVVTVVASDSDAAESGVLAAIFPGTFTFSRTGPISNALTAFFTLSGSAENGVDYRYVSNAVRFNPGQAQARVDIFPLNDDLAEGTENLVLTLQEPACIAIVPPPPGCYRVGPTNRAEVFIRDANSPPNQRPYVQLNEPRNGDVFTAPTNITLRAFAHDQEDGYQLRLEFFDGTNSLGLGEFVATTCPAPFCPYYQLVWLNAPPGNHTLIARATDSLGASSNSVPISITVQPREPSTNVTLVASGSVWKYLDNGTDQGTAWRQVEFNDSAWASGPAQLGYGDGDEATVVSFGPDPNNKYITTYFRRAFNVLNAASFSEIRGNLLQDDGTVLYLNGVEVLRNNLPGGPISYNTLASAVSVENQLVPFAASGNFLREGLNIVAVEMHQNSPASSDISFDLELIGIGPAQPPNQPPYVQINEPHNGDVFTAPTNIVLRAYAQDPEDSYSVTVEFVEGARSLGTGTFVPTRCAAPYCPYFELTWSNVPPGSYTLTARTTDRAGASSNSAPVNIIVRPYVSPTKLWEFAAGSIYSAPGVAADGTVYITAGNANSILYALTPQGVKKWEAALGQASSSPAIGADGTVYVGANRTLYAYSPTGALVWTYVFPQTPTFYFVSSPAIGQDGTIYIGTGTADKSLYAIRADGTLKWRFTADGTFAEMYTPVIGTDGTIYVGAYNDHFYAINPDGTRRWDVPMSGYNVSAAVGSNGVIYVVGSGFPNKLHAFTPAGVKLWESQIGGQNSQNSSAPIIGSDGTIYVGCGHDTSLYAFDPDGARRWVFAAPANAGGTSMSPTLDSEGNIYTGFGTNFFAVNASGRQVWSLASQGVFSAAALTAGGTLYVGSAAGSFYALQVEAWPAPSAWPMFQRDLRHTGAAPLIHLRQPVVNVVASDSDAAESGALSAIFPGTITFSRNPASSNALTVFFTVSGSAENGGDYRYVSNSVRFNPGQGQARIDIFPLNDGLVEGTESVVLTLQEPVCATILPPPPGCYGVGPSNRAEVFIKDADSPSDERRWIWARQEGGPSFDSIQGAAGDAAGNVFVIGHTSGPMTVGGKDLSYYGNSDGFLVKYNNAGQVLWAHSFGGPGYENSLGVAVDGAGNAYVAGQFDHTASFGSHQITGERGYDLFLAKYSPGGRVLWARSGKVRLAIGRSILAVDVTGNSVIVGQCSEGDRIGNFSLQNYGGNDAMIAKFDPGGNLLWATNAGGFRDDQFVGVSIDRSGNIAAVGHYFSNAVVGATQLVSTNDNELFVTKFSAGGQVLWARTYAGTKSGGHPRMASDLSGNSYFNVSFFWPVTFAGQEFTTRGAGDFVLVKINGNGDILWARQGGGPNDDWIEGLRVDSDNRVVVGGRYGSSIMLGSITLTSPGIQNGFVAKYDADGSVLWAHKEDGGETAALALDGQSNAYLGGHFYTTARFGAISLVNTTSQYQSFIAQLGSGVPKQDPIVTWSNPADIIYGTALDGTQLNAQADVPGTFDYDPPAGTVLSASTGTTLRVTFTPADPVRYNSVAAEVHLFVWPAPLTIRADNKSRLEGTPNPTLTATYIGLVNGETGLDIDIRPLLATTATISSPPGDYPITVSGASDRNYMIRYENGTLTVVRKPIPGLIPAPDSQEWAAVASDGANFFAVWMDRRNRESAWTEYDIYGARISASGEVLDPAGIPICTSVSSQWYPSVAFDGNNFLVVWSDGRDHTDTEPRLEIYGARVSREGRVLDTNGFEITHGEVAYQPTVAFNGTAYLVAAYARQHNGQSGDSAIAVRVTPAGVVLDTEEIVVFGPKATLSPVVVASVGGNWMVAWHYGGVQASLVRPDGSVGLPSYIGNRGETWMRGLSAVGNNYFLTMIANRQLNSDTVVMDIYGTWIDSAGQPFRTLLVSSNASQSTGSGSGQPTIHWQNHASAAGIGAEAMVVWEAGAVYTNGGNQRWTSDIRAARVSTTGSVSSVISICSAPQDQAVPSIAFNGQHFLAVWQDARSAPPQEENPFYAHDIYGARVAMTGNVAEPNGFLISSAVSNRPPQVSITVPSEGAVFEVSETIQIQAVTTDADGFASTVEFFANEQKIGEASMPSVPPGQPSRFEFNWTNPPAGQQRLTARTSDNGGARAVSQPVNIVVLRPPDTEPAPGDQQTPAVAANAEVYFVVWASDLGGGEWDIYGARITPEGRRLDLNPIPICTAPGPQTYPAVASDGRDFLVAWHGATDNVTYDDIYGARVTADGVVLDPNGFLISGAASSQFGASLAFNGTHYLVVWYDYRNSDETRLRNDIYGARVGADGVVLDPGGIAICTAENMQWAPGVAALGEDFFVAWDDSGTQAERGTIVTSAGVVRNPNGLLLSPNFSGYGPAVVANASGYLSLWTDGRNYPGTQYDIFARRVSAAGEVIGLSDFLICNAPGMQVSPALAAGHDQFLAVWIDDRAGFDNRAIFAARIGAGGVLDPNGFPIWHGRASEGWRALSVGSLNGEYLAAWTRGFNSDFGQRDIVAVRVNAGGEVLDSEPLLISTAQIMDSDRDGVSDERDHCPETAPGTLVDAEGCSADQRDSDNDGVPDSRDQCPNTPSGTAVDANGCPVTPPPPRYIVGWGCNFAGETEAPPGLTDVVKLAGGQYHTLALKRDGSLMAWGRNDFGQNDIPPAATGIVAIASLRFHDLAVTRSGTVIAWGYNYSRQTDVPEGLSNVVAVAAGFLHSLALKNDGTVIGWGDNGQSAPPADLHNVRAISAGATHSVALKSDGTLVAWGDNTYGQTDIPDGLANVVAIASGVYQSYALKRDGTVVGWGWNVANFDGLTGVVAIAAGGDHLVALKRDRTVVSGGYYECDDEIPQPALSNVVAIAAGGDHSLAIIGNPVGPSCACDAPWRNHAEYVACVVRHAWQLYRAGLITSEQRRNMVHDAVMSACGRHPETRERACLHLFPLTREECQREGLQFVLSGDVSGPCVLECSEDLINWRTVEPVSITGWEITCPLESGTKARFYRVRADE